MSERKQKLLWVSGSFQLLRVRVTKGKITVNVWRKFKWSSCYILVRLLLTEVYCMLIGSSLWSSFCKFSTCCLSSMPPISINSWNENVPLKIINYSITYVLLVIGLAKTHSDKSRRRLPNFFQKWWSAKCLKNVKISRYWLEHSFMIFTCHHHQFEIRNSVHINMKLNIKC